MQKQDFNSHSSFSNFQLECVRNQKLNKNFEKFLKDFRGKIIQKTHKTVIRCHYQTTVKAYFRITQEARRADLQ